MALKYDWDLDAYFSQKELLPLAPHDVYLQGLIGNSYAITARVLSACCDFHRELGECLERATDLRRDLEYAFGVDKRELRQFCHVFSEYCWNRFVEHYQAIVPDSYFRELASIINSLMNILKDKRRLRVRKKASSTA